MFSNDKIITSDEQIDINGLDDEESPSPLSAQEVRIDELLSAYSKLNMDKESSRVKSINVISQRLKAFSSSSPTRLKATSLDRPNINESKYRSPSLISEGNSSVEKVFFDLDKILDKTAQSLQSPNVTKLMNGKLVAPSISTSEFRCECCHQNIGPRHHCVQSQEKYWLKSHFNCCICGENLVNGEFKIFNQRLYCLKDQRFISATPCLKCGKLTAGSAVEALGGRFHAECFTCVYCNQVLTQSFVPVDGQPFCRECYLRKEDLTCAICNQLIDTGEI